MAGTAPSPDCTTEYSAHLVREVRKIAAPNLSDAVVQRARHAVLDWIGVTISGAQQPSSTIVRQTMLAEGGDAKSVAIGTSDMLTARQAALFAGVASHSQDYDDMGFGLHPSVAVLPAVFGLADEVNATGQATLEAMVQGYEAIKLANAAVGETSYGRGFHSTGVFGCFGAAIACASLLKLDEQATLSAYGTVGMMASGLRAGFGNMGKHLNAGNAAAAGVLAARLAENGFVGPNDVLENPVGFASAYNAPGEIVDGSRCGASLEPGLGVEQIIFKLHAACGGTHSAIEGIKEIRARFPFEIDDVADVELIVPQILPTICGIERPSIGTEAMFSIHFTSALALLGRGTGIDAFADQNVRDPALASAQELVRLTLVPGEILDMRKPVTVHIRMKSGDVRTAAIDVFEPVQKLDRQWDDLVRKFQELVAPIIGSDRSEELISLVSKFEKLDSIRELTQRARN